MRAIIIWGTIFLSLFLANCSPSEKFSEPNPQTLLPVNQDKEVNIRWTSHGIPHIKSDSWEGLGYGFAHAIATNAICVLAREFVTVRGKQAKYFGATEANINSDAFHLALLHAKKIDDYISFASDESNELDEGYVDGYNHFIETRAGKLPESCNNAPWITAITRRDLAKLSIGVGIRYGLGRVTNQIAAAEPNLELAQLDDLDLFIDPQTIGSNAIGIGKDHSNNGRGILLGNPHYPWNGPSRFHMAHMTMPGEINVMGASLITTNRIAIGFTERVAWSHTVSTALRFTMFKLELDDGNRMAYRLDDEIRDIEPIEVQVETEAGMMNRIVYMTHLGPVVAATSTPWDDEHVYVMRDVNYENYRSGDQYMSITKARNVTQLRDALATHQGAAFVNTVAADIDGGTLYADMSAIPNVSAELIDRCAVDTGNSRVITLNGSDSTCNWEVDSNAAFPGLMPPNQQPSLITDTYVSNSNDSYWLSNPDQKLEGFSPIIGNEREIRSLRTRAGLNFIEEILTAGQKFSQELVQNLLFNHRHYGAEIFLDDILTVCAQDSSLRDACNILSNWDRRQDIDSEGAVLFNRFWEIAKDLSPHYAETFDPTNAAHTPRGLRIDDEGTRSFILASLNQAIRSLNDAGIDPNAKWGDAQFVLRQNEKIGIPGGAGGQGMFSVITARFDKDGGGYTPILHGNSYIQAVTWNDDSTPNAKAILTYSQSPEPDSEYYSDLTELYSQSEWIDLPFTDDEIQANLVKEETLRF